MQKVDWKQDIIVSAKQLNTAALAPRLASRHPLLDSFLEGGLSWGEISEWGIPWGVGIRDLILPFLISAQESQPPQWVLWIYGQREITINASAWSARGVRLDLIRFAHSRKPLGELKALFLSGFFRVVVLDDISPLTREEFAFLAHQARRLQQHIFLLRNEPLSQEKGNPWARLRLNVSRQTLQQTLCLQALKGRKERQLLLPCPLPRASSTHWSRASTEIKAVLDCSWQNSEAESLASRRQS